jgi:hypothetical protein
LIHALSPFCFRYFSDSILSFFPELALNPNPPDLLSSLD